MVKYGCALRYIVANNGYIMESIVKKGSTARHIVLVDRDEVSLWLSGHLLRSCGYDGDMIFFSSIATAGDYLKTARPDLVIMDFFQSYGDDFTLMAKVHAITAVQLVVTGEFLTDKQEMDRRFNNYKFLRKPLSVELVKMVLG